MRALVPLLLAVTLTTPARALPEGVLEVGGGAALGSAIGGLLGGAAVLVLADNDVSIARGVGLEAADTAIFVDAFGPPTVGAVGGAALGAFIVSAMRGQPLSPAPATAAGGSLLLGGLCATPGILGAVESFDQAEQADDCGQSCGAIITGVIFIGIGVTSFCVGAPVGAALGGAGGAALVAPEVPPPPSEVAPAPEGPPAANVAPMPPPGDADAPPAPLPPPTADDPPAAPPPPEGTGDDAEADAASPPPPLSDGPPAAPAPEPAPADTTPPPPAETPDDGASTP